jgi:hypothetical protein
MRIYFPVILLFTLLITGCGPNRYLVEANYVHEAYDAKPNITESKAYHELFKDIKSIAVKAPDDCSNETESQKTGQARPHDTVLKTRCGVVMALIERELTKAGFEVISWKELDSAVKVSRLNGTALTPLQAARHLKSDVLLQINSFERTSTNPERDSRWETRFYRSNMKGGNLGMATVDENTKTQLIAQAKDSIKDKSEKFNRRLSATINATAIYNNGQSIWFYEWNHIEPLDSRNNAIKFNMACEEGKCAKYEIQTPPAKKTKTKSSGDNIGISSNNSPEDVEMAKYNKLMEDVIQNMVVSFAKG